LLDLYGYISLCSCRGILGFQCWWVLCHRRQEVLLWYYTCPRCYRHCYLDLAYLAGFTAPATLATKGWHHGNVYLWLLVSDLGVLPIDAVANECSICAAAISLIVAASVFDDKSPDLTWNICNIVVWATVEVNLINVSGMLLSHSPL
jgi:hypothetical protein